MGWGYSDWNGVFYPAEIASREMISHYARAFDTVEIDSTFYGTPRIEQVRNWRRATPETFVFCPKVPRLITHDMGLRGVEADLRAFVEVMSALGPKRGPMLLQMPPSFTRADLPALEAFLPLLGALDDPDARFAIEFRHRSLIGTDVSALLKENNVALALADYVAMPRRFEVTADFLYLRLIGQHGAMSEYHHLQKDRMPDLVRWATVLQERADRYGTAYVFCNNEYEGYGIETANRFKKLLGQETIERPPDVQGSLF